MNILNPESIGNPDETPIVEVPAHMVDAMHEAINGNRRSLGMPPMGDTPCAICKVDVGSNPDGEVWRVHGVATHTACLDTRHTFYSVKLDGMGGPGFDSREAAELFIEEDLKHLAEPVEYTREDYTIHPFEETWRENFARGEWDGW